MNMFLEFYGNMHSARAREEYLFALLITRGREEGEGGGRGLRIRLRDAFRRIQMRPDRAYASSRFGERDRSSLEAQRGAERSGAKRRRGKRRLT